MHASCQRRLIELPLGLVGADLAIGDTTMGMARRTISQPTRRPWTVASALLTLLR